MTHPSTDQTVRPGVLVAVVGSIAVTVALVWALKGKPSPTEVAVETAAPVSPAASAKRVAAFRLPARRAGTVPEAANPERRRWTGATRLSMAETGAAASAPGAATSLPGFEGAATFDYQAQAAQVAEVVRNAIAQEERRDNVRSPGSAIALAPSQGAAVPVYQAQPRPAGRVPEVILQPGSGGDVRSPGSGAQFTGSPGPGPSGSQAQAGPGAEGVGNAVTPPELGGGATAPGSGAQVSQGSGPAEVAVVINAVDAYREGERLRRAYVEEMRLRRIATIVAARQSEGT